MSPVLQSFSEKIKAHMVLWSFSLMSNPKQYSILFWQKQNGALYLMGRIDLSKITTT